MSPVPAAVQAMLGALDGVAYLVAPDGELVAIGSANWDLFAVANGAEQDCAAATVGRNLFDIVRTDPVRAVYRRLHKELLAGVQTRVSFEYRCDAPDRRREMRMALSRLDLPGEAPLILYHSQMLSAVARPWMSLFEPERIVEVIRAESGLPIVRICSFCQQVDDDGEWIEADEYYRRGGGSDVRVSHGVCGGCTDRLEQLP